MKRLSWKYIAGLVDGEGCIDFQLTYHKDYPGSPYITPRIRIALVEPSRFVLDMLLANHGGYILDKKINHKNENWQDACYWTLQGKALRPFLQNIVNHLYIKKEQAKLVIWIIDNMLGKHVSEELREHLRQEMKAMKRDPHRLTERAVEKAEALNDSYVRQRAWSNHHEKCQSCGTTDIKHAGNGYCRKCYDNSRPIEKIEQIKQYKREAALKRYYDKKSTDVIVGSGDA